MARDIATHSTNAVARFQGSRASRTSEGSEGLEAEDIKGASKKKGH